MSQNFKVEFTSNWGKNGNGDIRRSFKIDDRSFAILEMDNPDENVRDIAPKAYFFIASAINEEYVDLRIDDEPNVILGSSDGFTYVEDYSEAEDDMTSLGQNLRKFCPRSGHFLTPLTMGGWLCEICKYYEAGWQIMNSKFEIEARLIKIDFQNMLVNWGASQPLRTGLHASSVLASDQEWCVREHVLVDVFPNQVEKPEPQSWDWRREAIFENGWDLHRRWQRVFAKFANVVQTDLGEGLRPELDLTHYDEIRNIYFSPDAILEFGGEKYVVEIKGIGHASYEKLTDSLEVARSASETVDKAYFQAQLYMHLLNLKKAILLIENKNNQDFHVWVIGYEKEASVKPVQRTYTVKAAILLTRMHGLEKLPPRISVCQSRGDERAKKCPMRNICFSNVMKLEGTGEEVK